MLLHRGLIEGALLVVQGAVRAVGAPRLLPGCQPVIC